MLHSRSRQESDRKEEGKRAKGKRQVAQSLFIFIKKTTALPEALPGRLLVTFLGHNGHMVTPTIRASRKVNVCDWAHCHPDEKNKGSVNKKSWRRNNE